MKRIFLALACLAFALPSFSASAAEKEWTFLLFLNGNNNLDSYGALNINQMEEVGSSASVNLVVQWASLRNGNTRRLYVEKDNDSSRVTSPTVEDLGKADMGDAQVLENFIRWGMSTYPAKHYFVAVWDHGSGWHRKQTSLADHRNISFDDNTGHSITTKQLGAVMNNVAAVTGRKIDIYGSDACLMGMVDIAGEMKNSVDYFAGSQDLEPGEGWPYKEIFAALDANPAMSGRDLSNVLADEYAKSYSAGGSNHSDDVTMSAFDMSQYDVMRAAVSRLGAEIIRSPLETKSKIFTAAKSAQDFAYSDYVDFGDFVKRMGVLPLRDFDASILRSAADAVQSFVVSSRNTGSFRNATGISIWIPKDQSKLNTYLARYRDLQFDQDTLWSAALTDFVGK